MNRTKSVLQRGNTAGLIEALNAGLMNLGASRRNHYLERVLTADHCSSRARVNWYSTYRCEYRRFF